MQIIFATLVSALATVDFAKIATVVPQDWTVKGKGIQNCSLGNCLLSSKPDDKEVFAGVDFSFRIHHTQKSKQIVIELDVLQADFQDLYTDYLSAVEDKVAYAGVSIRVDPTTSLTFMLVAALSRLEVTSTVRLAKDKVILILNYDQYKDLKNDIDALNIKGIAVKFASIPNFANGFKLGHNVVCLADDVIGAKIYDVCNGQVYDEMTSHLAQLSPDVKKCDA